MNEGAPLVVAVGDNVIPIWGMSNAERVRRIADKQKLRLGAVTDTAPKLLVNLAFCFDPPLLRHLASSPDTIILAEGVPVIAHVRDEATAQDVAAAMANGAPLGPAAVLHRIDHGPDFAIYNRELRKREQPFILPLRADTVRAVERASYYAAYKGVTDLLTKYLWPEWALFITRIAAKIGLSPNGVTGIGLLLCVAATLLFWHGWYWSGCALGLIFMVLDTVDGKLARCTITSSWWGNIFDHGIDLIHPPIWYFAWATGLAAWGLAFSPELFWTVQAVLLAGYVAQRLIEGAFIRLFGMHIHVWRPFDSRFRLITARRNPNMVILSGSLLIGRPDLGLLGVAAWTVASLLVHCIQLAQASLARRRGEQLVSWLA